MRPNEDKQKTLFHGHTSFCAGTSSSPRRPSGFHGDFFLASSHCLPQLLPALLLLHLPPPLCSYVSLLSPLLRHHPRPPLHFSDVTWASCAPTVPRLDCRSGCGDGAGQACPPSRARESPWHPVGHERSGGDARFYDCACSPRTRRAPGEASPSQSPLLQLLPLGQRVRGGVSVCGARRQDGAG